MFSKRKWRIVLDIFNSHGTIDRSSSRYFLFLSLSRSRLMLLSLIYVKFLTTTRCSHHLRRHQCPMQEGKILIAQTSASKVDVCDILLYGIRCQSSHPNQQEHVVVQIQLSICHIGMLMLIRRFRLKWHI